jgi:hypothetical protein
LGIGWRRRGEVRRFWLGRAVHALFISARLRAIFDFRRDYLAGLWKAD